MTNKQIFLYLLVSTILVATGFVVGYFFTSWHFSSLEVEFELLSKQWGDNLKSGQEIKMDELKQYVDSKLEAYRSQYNILTYIGLPVTVAAILASIFGGYKWAIGYAQEQYNNDPDVAFKDDKTIVVLSGNKQDEEWIKKFMQATEFKKVEYFIIAGDDISQLGNNTRDLAIINYPTDTTGKKDLLEKVTFASSVFYFGKGRAENERLDANGKLSYANTKSQLYANIINALKLQQFKIKP